MYSKTYGKIFNGGRRELIKGRVQGSVSISDEIGASWHA